MSVAKKCYPRDNNDQPKSKKRRTGLERYEEARSVGEISDNPSDLKDLDDSTVVSKLPQGFFDDPKLEAKVRNSTYQDPVDAEVIKFNKEIEEENQRVEKSVEEDLVELQKERNLEEIDSQIEKWARIEELQRRAEKLKSKLGKSEQEAESETESDNEDSNLSDIDGFSDWKKKSTITR